MVGGRWCGLRVLREWRQEDEGVVMKEKERDERKGAVG